MKKLAALIEKVKEQNKDLDSLRYFFRSKFPNTIQALQIVNNDYLQPKRRQGLNLVPITTKKNGIRYYARFSYNGVKIPTKFNTYQSDPVLAERYARENRDRLIEQYFARKDGQIYKFLSNFYKKESDIPEVKVLSERNRRDYENKINNAFIPFLKNEKIISFDQIKKTSFTKYQEQALNGKFLNPREANRTGIQIKPQSVSNYMKPVKKIFNYLYRKGEITENSAESVKCLPVGKNDIIPRGCYDLDLLRGVFNKRWKNDLSCLLCVIIYTTGMRNSEIRRIALKDIVKIGNCRFIQIIESKTSNGVRQVPLHDFVYKKLINWAEKSKRQNLLFEDCNNKIFVQANRCLANMLNVTEEKMKSENISFYSGRHFYKTLLSAEGLGENIEEIFMGHKITSNVKQSYNHRDKQGKKRLERKARQALSILDKCIFLKKAVKVLPHGRRGSGGAATVKR